MSGVGACASCSDCASCADEEVLGDRANTQGDAAVVECEREKAGYPRAIVQLWGERVAIEWGMG